MGKLPVEFALSEELKKRLVIFDNFKNVFTKVQVISYELPQDILAKYFSSSEMQDMELDDGRIVPLDKDEIPITLDGDTFLALPDDVLFVGTSQNSKPVSPTKLVEEAQLNGFWIFVEYSDSQCTLHYWHNNRVSEDIVIGYVSHELGSVYGEMLDSIHNNLIRILEEKRISIEKLESIYAEVRNDCFAMCSNLSFQITNFIVSKSNIVPKILH